MVCIYIFPFNVLLYPFPLKFNNFQFCWKLDIWILLYGNSEFRFLRICWVLILQAFSVPGFRLRCLAPKGKQGENEAGQNSGSVALNTLLQPIGVVTMGTISLIRSNNQHTQLFALGLTGEWWVTATAPRAETDYSKSPLEAAFKKTLEFQNSYIRQSVPVQLLSRWRDRFLVLPTSLLSLISLSVYRSFEVEQRRPYLVL